MAQQGITTTPPVVATPLTHGDRIYFQPSTPRYGVAEFIFCQVWTRGKLKRVFITRRQQPNVEPQKYVLECHNRPDFTIGSWIHRGIDNPRIWLQHWCHEHKAIALYTYVPRNSNTMHIATHGVYFDHTIEAPNPLPRSNAP